MMATMYPSSPVAKELMVLLKRWCVEAKLPSMTVEWHERTGVVEVVDGMIFPVAEGDLVCQFEHPLTASENMLLRTAVREYLMRQETHQILHELIHEVGNPLAVLDGQLQFLYESAGFDNASRWASVFRAIEQMTCRMREAALPGKDGMQDLDVPAVLNHIFEDLNLAMQEKDVHVKSCIGTTDLMWYAGPLQQILFNLLKNAVEASERGGTVVVETTTNPGTVQIRVQNQGLPIQSDIVRHLFTPYYSSKGIGHRGLGLTLSRRLAEQGGATLDYVASQGFLLTIPVTQREATD